MLRQARLRSDYQEWYPEITPGVWHNAAWGHGEGVTATAARLADMSTGGAAAIRGALRVPGTKPWQLPLTKRKQRLERLIPATVGRGIACRASRLRVGNSSRLPAG
jgi:hypothetical protein